jgi:hypothetical protein
VFLAAAHGLGAARLAEVRKMMRRSG